MTQVLVADPIQRTQPAEAIVAPALASPRRFPRQGEWTYADWLELPNDGWKYEILDGVLYMSPPPLISHQDTLLELAMRMRNQARSKRLVRIFTPVGGAYRLMGEFTGDDNARSSVLTDFTIVVKTLFELEQGNDDV
jgi:hypothetical protein